MYARSRKRKEEKEEWMKTRNGKEGEWKGRDGRKKKNERKENERKLLS